MACYVYELQGGHLRLETMGGAWLCYEQRLRSFESMFYKGDSWTGQVVTSSSTRNPAN